MTGGSDCNCLHFQRSPYHEAKKVVATADCQAGFETLVALPVDYFAPFAAFAACVVALFWLAPNLDPSKTMSGTLFLG